MIVCIKKLNNILIKNSILTRLMQASEKVKYPEKNPPSYQTLLSSSILKSSTFFLKIKTVSFQFYSLSEWNKNFYASLRLPIPLIHTIYMIFNWS